MSSPANKFDASRLRPGKTYRVIYPFTDYDGLIHSVGETWQFLEKNFLPYEDGLTLKISVKGQEQWLRLQWRAETQGEIIDNFSDYVEEI